jgi:tetratricopeptide (TPR) repeat protein
VLIAGEPGIGKARLAHHFASAALADGATVLMGRCSDEPLAPFEPFAEALAWAGAEDALEPGDTDDTGARHRLFNAVDSALADLAARAPLLLVIDDFHWADRGTLLLDRLACEDAAERFKRALEALELAGAEDESWPVLLARGDALLRAGEPDLARAAFSTARALAVRRGDHTLLAEAALGFAGLGIAIVDLDVQVIARLEEALERVEEPALRSRAQSRLAVELYHAADRTRSESLSADAVATAQASGDSSALASAPGAQHVALWRPRPAVERLAVAGDVIAAARTAGDRHAELQGHNWRVADLFELGDMPGWREETVRHARLAEELRLPVYEWYTPLWAAVDAMLAGRYDDVERSSLAQRTAPPHRRYRV